MVTAVDAAYRASWGKVLAGLIAHLGDFDLAEEALSEAFARAVEKWTEDAPANPEAWLFTTAKRTAIDRIRRRSTRVEKASEVKRLEEERFIDDEHGFGDHRLRLVFTCCHPALSREAQVALTLRTVCGLTTDEIGRAFLVPPSTMAQRLVRAKKKIRAAKIPYRVPPAEDLPTRLPALLAVVYLVFTEGYAPTKGDAVVRPEICDEAIRLGRLLAELLPEEPEVLGLLALMVLHHGRRDARADADGELVLLDDQDRSRWREDELAEGRALAAGALRKGHPGPYQLQAAIAAVHAEASNADATDWDQVVGLYEILNQQTPSPVVGLNLAVAVAMARGPEAGLARLAPLEPQLARYHLFFAARAELLFRQGDVAGARESWCRAARLATHERERRFLAQKISQCDRASEGGPS